ncbi:MAG: pyridoxal-phosphate dependent enzyme [Conexivisphaera sp.]
MSGEVMDADHPGSGGRVDTVCIVCGERSPGVHMRCPRCGGPAILEIEDIRWDVRRDVPSMWRYESMLPAMRRRVSLGEGMTPIRRVGDAHVKLEGRNPTGSYADRASSVVASHIASEGGGVEVAVEYSEDFAYSVARYLRGISEVEVAIPDPSRVDPQEVVALVEMGARVSFGRSGREMGYANSLSVEGLKTIALEVIEKSPRVERVVVPAETGLLALSIWKGLRDAENAGAGADLEVEVAILRGSGMPDVLSRIRGVAVHEVDPEDAVRGLVELARAGIRAKVLSAAAFALAEELGRGLAVVTASQRRPQVRRRGESALMADVVRAVGEMEEASAYDLWRELRRYTLRGIYKAVEALEAEGELCARHVVRGGRKVRVYSRCVEGDG